MLWNQGIACIFPSRIYQIYGCITGTSRGREDPSHFSLMSVDSIIFLKLKRSSCLFLSVYYVFLTFCHVFNWCLQMLPIMKDSIILRCIRHAVWLSTYTIPPSVQIYFAQLIKKLGFSLRDPCLFTTKFDKYAKAEKQVTREHQSLEGGNISHLIPRRWEDRKYISDSPVDL